MTPVGGAGGGGGGRAWGVGVNPTTDVTCYNGIQILSCLLFLVVAATFKSFLVSSTV